MHIAFVCFTSSELLLGKILNKSVTFLFSNLPHLYICFFLEKDFHYNCFFVFWQNSLDALEKKNLALELELVKAKKDSNGSLEKLREVEHKCSELQQNVKR